MTNGKKMTRRAFSKSTAAGVATLSATSIARAAGANERVQLGFIGIGNRGDQVLSAFRKHADTAYTAMCDVYRPYLDRAAELVGSKPATMKDYRRMLDRKDVDAVVIATPDHWHALQFIDACEAGKDVYVEKPLSLTVVEGRKMVEAAERTKRITLLGVHFRSANQVVEACEFIRSGGIGHVTMARCYHLANDFPIGIGNPPDCDPPEGLDWDLWLGPAPKVNYNPNYCLYKFRWFYPYSGGQVTNFGTHWLDIIQRAIGKEYPKAVTAVGGNYALKDNRTIPDTCEVIWEYEGGTMACFMQVNANATGGNRTGTNIEIRGTKGTAYFGWSNVVIEAESPHKHAFPALSPLHRKENSQQRSAVVKAMENKEFKSAGDPTAAHARNFLDCVKSRKPTRCPVALGHRSTSTLLIGNIALRTRKFLEWDGSAERFTNDEEANKLLHYGYRKPWKLA